jgi:tetratricopeptide (TPR) repeat protein
MPYILLVRLTYLFTIALLLVACHALRSQNKQLPSCSTYARCNELGAAALKQGRVDEAIELFKQQAALAEVADIDLYVKADRTHPHAPYSVAVPAYNNLALSYYKKHDYLWARAWAHVALRWAKNNSAARFNLRKIEEALAKWRWPQTTSGEYVQYAGRGTWQTFIVNQDSTSKIDFSFDGLWWGADTDAPSGIGDLSGTTRLHHNRAEYLTHDFGECHISMEFAADKLTVVQASEGWDCGFGHNVSANGTFERVSTKPGYPSQEGR